MHQTHHHHRVYTSHGKSAKHKILRRSDDSEDDGLGGSNVGSNERLQMTSNLNNNINTSYNENAQRNPG